jgi:hypothetical protein
MSARQELAEVIASKLDRLFGAREFGPATQDFELADHLIAAGYRKPRTITTAEELDALPVGSVVLSQDYRHHVDEWRVSFQRWQDGDWYRGARSSHTHPDNFLPATVLHTPEVTP